MQDLSILINALEAPSCITDVSGRILSHNALFAEHCQHDVASLDGTLLEDLWEASQRPAFKDYLTHLKSLPAGQTVQPFAGLSMVAKPIHFDGRWLVLCQGKHRETKDPLLHFFFEHIDQGFWDYDAKTEKITVSDAWREMRGYAPGADVNSTKGHWLDEVHPDDRADLKRLFDGQLRGETSSFALQYRRLHEKTNDWIWIHCRATVIASDANGRPLRMVGTDTDITDIKNSETRLEQLNNKVELAIDVSGIGMFEFDLNSSRVYWDDRLLAMYGLPPGQNERSGDEWGKFIHPEDAEDTIAYSEERALTLSDINRDFRIVRPDGQVRHLRTMARYVALSDNETKLIGVNIDITDDVLRAQQLEDARKQLEFDSRHDALTGLANRRKLDETLAEIAAEPDHSELCFMHLDLDYFKEINDSLGHAAGDAVLEHVANTLITVLDEARLICRIGGDEFAVLFVPAPSPGHARDLAEAVISAFQHPFIFEGQACSFSVSIGSAIGRDTKRIFANADIALYAAKNAGRSRYHAYTERTGARSDQKLRRHQDLVDAIAENKIECWYQPQFDASTLQIVSAEALARMRLGPDAIWAPDDFLPLAEKTGLLAEIEEFIFRRVLEDQNKWAKAGLVYPSISVNISENRLAETKVVERIKQQFQSHHIVSLELLETAFLDDPGTLAHRKIEELRSLGCAIELDDFGSGHASILSLLAIKPDKVKIDQRLTKEIATSHTAIEILQGLVGIARTQNAGIVLEGIETEDLLAATKQIDCDVLQGYALSPPITADAFAALLEDRPRHRVGET